MGKSVDEREKLKKALRKQTSPWVRHYKVWPDAEHMIQSLLAGASYKVAERLGELTEEQRLRGARGYNLGSWLTGQNCAERVNLSAFERS